MKEPEKIGIIGGGQLAKMLCIAAASLGKHTACYSTDKNCPASQVCSNITAGSFSDEEWLTTFAKSVDVITFEFENINCEPFRKITESSPQKLKPNIESIYITQNRIREKKFLKELGLPIANFYHSEDGTIESSFLTTNPLPFPAVIKTADFGYDGKGQFRVNSVNDAIDVMSHNSFNAFVIEELVDFEFEFSCITFCNTNNDIVFLPITKNVHRDGILRTSTPLQNSEDNIALFDKAQGICRKICSRLSYTGALCVEFFYKKDGTILINEIAPRVHNSGHYSLDLCTHDQFELHIMSICGMPLPTPKLTGHGQMVNIIGEEYYTHKSILAKDNAKLYLYGKDSVQPGRKMGHYNLFL